MGPHNEKEEGNTDPQGRECVVKDTLVCCVEPPYNTDPQDRNCVVKDTLVCCVEPP